MASPTRVHSDSALAVGVGARQAPDDGEGIKLDLVTDTGALATLLGRGSEDSARAKTSEPTCLGSGRQRKAAKQRERQSNP